MRDPRLRAATAGDKLYAHESRTGRVRSSPGDGESWTPPVGVDAERRVQTSCDGGRTRQAGCAGRAAAFAAVDGNRLLAALEDGTVHEPRTKSGDIAVAFRPAGT
ncbi:hypothetical protein [Nonomuraea sp. C10]|uniref:hypothetical protein n=1 Tax=Nonomuraea sp. C10 TaxID=2600577 RepID=UPI0011CDEEBC|nr:hypothetical protein [Nonomuraea sp. C10]TXK35281.1 hypothetical protein FR742_39260 [Nonomuraea sp. C10]